MPASRNPPQTNRRFLIQTHSIEINYSFDYGEKREKLDEFRSYDLPFCSPIDLREYSWAGCNASARHERSKQCHHRPSNQTSARPKARSDNTYIIGDADVLSISVWKDPTSKQVPVRSDGKISLPLVGEVQATDRPRCRLEQVITEKLKGYMTDPEVTVIVEQINSQKYNIFGQVMKPGSLSITAGTTIMDAIAASGGLRDFAKKKSIYVLRPTSGGGEARFDFNYEKFIKGKSPAQNIL